MTGLLTRRLAVLCRLQRILAWRQSGSSKQERLIFTIFLAPFLVFGGTVAAYSMFTLSRKLARGSPEYVNILLMGIGGFVFLSFLLSLLLERNSSLWFDFSRLFHMPVTAREIVVSQVFGFAVNPLFMVFPTLLFLGCAAGAGSAGRPLLAAGTVVGGALWVLQVSLVLMVGEFLRCHVRISGKVARWVTFAVLLTVLAGTVAWAWLGRYTAGDGGFGTFFAAVGCAWESGRVWIVLLPGISPLAWVGGGWRSLGALPAALLEIVALGVAATALLGRLMTEGIAVSGGGPACSVEASSTPLPWQRLGWWPHFEKELKCTLRERYQLFGIGSIAVLAFMLPRLAMALGPWGEAVSRVLVPPALAVLISLGTLNQFGLEGAALPLFLTSPAPRWACLLGKNLVGLTLLTLLLAGHEGLRLAQGAGWAEVSYDLLFALGVLAVLSGLGNLFSILLPYPAAIPGKNLFPQVSQSRLMVISLCQMVYLGFAGYALLPLVAGRYALAVFGGKPTVALAGAAAMVVYTACLYGLLLAGGGKVLSRMEGYLFEKLQKSNG